MGKAVWQAAKDGNEAELRRLIERGGNVNWRNPAVRRRMCLAWAPASTPPLSSVAPAAPARHGAIFPTAQLHGARRTPACSPIRLTPLALEDGSCVRPVLRFHSSDDCLKGRARRVRPTRHRVRGERERHARKSGAPSPKHTPWVRFHVVISFESSLLSSGRRMVSFALRGNQRPPRDRQASSRRGRRCDSSNQGRRDGHRLRTEGGQERGRGPAERASVRERRPNRMRTEC